MPSDPQGKRTPPNLRIVPSTRAARAFRRLLRISVNGLLACINRRHPEARDFDQIEVSSEEYFVEEVKHGEVISRQTVRKRKFVIPTLFIVSLLSALAYYLLK